TSLANVTIPSTVTNIGGYAFLDCASLSEISVNSLNPSYCSVDGVLFNFSRTTLIQYPGGKTGSYTVPNSTINIEGWAFSRCTNLTSVTIPDSVINIGSSAFSLCVHLVDVMVGNKVASISDNLFSLCFGLTTVVIPDSVTNI